MTLVKICGITNFDDARAAIKAGADMLGFNFYRPSPRFIAPRDARAIIERLRAELAIAERRVTTVGVFVNEMSPAAVLNIANEAGVEAIQLHGDESVEFCNAVKGLSQNRFLIKVLRAGEGFQPESATAYNVDAIMLDALDRTLYGGTGHVLDWSIAGRTRELVPRLFLAGGMSPENVSEAITMAQPYAVDACSALESKPGTKDHERLRLFVEAARR
jgi:phosphoribosylanthranilate isomerase